MEGANLPNTDDTRWPVRPLHGGHVGVLATTMYMYSTQWEKSTFTVTVIIWSNEKYSYPRSSIVSVSCYQRDNKLIIINNKLVYKIYCINHTALLPATIQTYKWNVEMQKYSTCNVRYNGVLACVHWCSLQAFFYMKN